MRRTLRSIFQAVAVVGTTLGSLIHDGEVCGGVRTLAFCICWVSLTVFSIKCTMEAAAAAFWSAYKAELQSASRQNITGEVMTESEAHALGKTLNNALRKTLVAALVLAVAVPTCVFSTGELLLFSQLPEAVKAPFQIYIALSGGAAIKDATVAVITSWLASRDVVIMMARRGYTASETAVQFFMITRKRLGINWAAAEEAIA